MAEKGKVRYDRALTLRISDVMYAQIVKAAGSSRSVSEQARYFIEKALTTDILADNKLAIREVVMEEIAKQIKPATERLAKLVIKNFYESAVGRNLSQMVIEEALYNTDLSEEQNAKILDELLNSAKIKAAQSLRNDNEK